MRVECPHCGTWSTVTVIEQMDVLAGARDAVVTCDGCEEDVPFIPEVEAIVCGDRDV